jgi:potassium efflux system protein
VVTCREPDTAQTTCWIINTCRELIDRLNCELKRSTNQSRRAKSETAENAAETPRDNLDEQMFRIPSNKPLGLEWFSQHRSPNA